MEPAVADECVDAGRGDVEWFTGHSLCQRRSRGDELDNEPIAGRCADANQSSGAQ